MVECAQSVVAINMSGTDGVEEPVTLAVGCSAKIIGLKNRSDLNGQRATLLGWVDASLRWAIVMHPRYRILGAAEAVKGPEMVKGEKVVIKSANLGDVQPPSSHVAEACCKPDVISAVMNELGLCNIEAAARTSKVWQESAAAKAKEWGRLKLAGTRYLDSVFLVKPKWLPTHPVVATAQLPGGDTAIVACSGVHIVSASGEPKREIGEHLGPDDDEYPSWCEGPAGLASDGKYLYVTESPDDGLRKIDACSGRLLATQYDMYQPSGAPPPALLHSPHRPHRPAPLTVPFPLTSRGRGRGQGLRHGTQRGKSPF